MMTPAGQRELPSGHDGPANLPSRRPGLMPGSGRRQGRVVSWSPALTSRKPQRSLA